MKCIIAGLALVACSAGAQAQTAAQGYAIFQNGLSNASGTVPACATCHTTDPNSNVNNIQTFVEDNAVPAGVLTAWTLAPMSSYPFATVIDTAGQEALSAYIVIPAAGTQPYSSFSSNAVTFASTAVGKAATPQTVTLTNIGAAAITGLVIQARTSAAGVTESDNCPASLAAQASCTLTFNFSPLAAGTANAAYVASSSSDADTAPEVFVYATGAGTSPSASGGGGGGGVTLGALAGLVAACCLRRRAS